MGLVTAAYGQARDQVKAKRVRKPRPLKVMEDGFEWIGGVVDPGSDDLTDIHVDIPVGGIKVKEARRLAAWLVRAADYLDAKKESK